MTKCIKFARPLCVCVCGGGGGVLGAVRRLFGL
jgi:hypothetical protein